MMGKVLQIALVNIHVHTSAVSSSLLSVVRRIRKFFIQVSKLSSKCSGKSCKEGYTIYITTVSQYIYIITIASAKFSLNTQRIFIILMSFSFQDYIKFSASSSKHYVLSVLRKPYCLKYDQH